MGLVELATVRFVEMSNRAAALLGTTPELGRDLSYLSVTERPQAAAQTFRLLRDGALDGIRGRRRFHRSDGSMVELGLVGWAIRSAKGTDLGIWIASETLNGENDPVGGAVVAPAVWGRTNVSPDGDPITLDDHWRIAHIGPTGAAMFGRRPNDLLGSSIFELSHPDDLGGLVLAFARSTTERRAGVTVRLRDKAGGWRTIRAVVALSESDGTLPFSLVAESVAEPDAAGVNHIAEHLRRIAAQIETAGNLQSPFIQRADALGLPAMSNLSAREFEIASRLITGQRVRTIAAELYLSPGTVRNHLSAVFAKFGVHSQEDLLALVRDVPHMT